MVTVYTKSNCRPCMQTKKTLSKMEISYNEVSLEENPEILASFVARGFKAAPIVETPEGTWSGFKPEHLKALSA